MSTHTIDCTNQVIDIRLENTYGEPANMAFSNVPPAGVFTELTIILTYPAGFMPESNPLWPAHVHFPDNRPPTLAAHSNVIRLITVDGGVNWYGTHDTVIDVFSRLATTATNGQVVTYRNGWVTETPSGGGGSGTDYYSTIYDLSPSIAVTGTTVEIDPANGFTQYGNLVYYSNGNIPTVFGLKKGLATGRRWIVRIMLVMDGNYDQYARHDLWDIDGSATTGTITWVLPPINPSSMYPDEILLCEFFTIDGGTTWVGTQLTGEAYNPM